MDRAGVAAAAKAAGPYPAAGLYPAAAPEFFFFARPPTVCRGAPRLCDGPARASAAFVSRVCTRAGGGDGPVFRDGRGSSAGAGRHCNKLSAICTNIFLESCWEGTSPLGANRRRTTSTLLDAVVATCQAQIMSVRCYHSTARPAPAQAISELVLQRLLRP